jgi:hypothetical protein
MGKHRGGGVGGGSRARGGVSKGKRTTELSERLDAELDAALAAQQARTQSAAQKRRLVAGQQKVKSAAAEAGPGPGAGAVASLVAHGESLFVALALGGDTER